MRMHTHTHMLTSTCTCIVRSRRSLKGQRSGRSSCSKRALGGDEVKTRVGRVPLFSLSCGYHQPLHQLLFFYTCHPNEPPATATAEHERDDCGCDHKACHSDGNCNQRRRISAAVCRGRRRYRCDCDEDIPVGSWRRAGIKHRPGVGPKRQRVLGS